MYLYIMNGFEEGCFIQLEGEITQLGRSDTKEWEGKTNDVVLIHDRMISQVHAQFITSDQGVVVKDLNSSHGIMVNDPKTGKLSKPRKIGPGDVVIVGETLLLVCESNEHIPPLHKVAAKTI
jgi:pSer/pThr/pTyr-binding forkhead associated (FHA) protein